MRGICSEAFHRWVGNQVSVKTTHQIKEFQSFTKKFLKKHTASTQGKIWNGKGGSVTERACSFSREGRDGPRLQGSKRDAALRGRRGLR